MPFTAWVHLEIRILSEVCQAEKDEFIWYQLYVESKKKVHLFTKQKQTHRHRKQSYDGYQKVKGERDKLGICD